MSAPDVDAPLLSSYGALLRRSWWLVAGGAALGLVAGTGLTMVQEPTYTARAEVEVGRAAVDTDPLTPAEDAYPPGMDTEAAVATSLLVGERVAAALAPLASGASGGSGAGTTPDEAAAALRVTVPANTRILALSYTATTPRAAQTGALAAAEGYLAVRGDLLQDLREAREGAVQERVAGLRTDLAAQQQVAADEDVDDARREAAQRRVRSLATQAGALQEQLNALAAEEPSPGQVVQAPGLPRRPSGPDQSVPVTSGLALGLLAGAGAAALRGRRAAQPAAPGRRGGAARAGGTGGTGGTAGTGGTGGADRPDRPWARLVLAGTVTSLDDAAPLADPGEQRLRRLVHAGPSAPHPRTVLVTGPPDGPARGGTPDAPAELAQRLVAEARRAGPGAPPVLLVDLAVPDPDGTDAVARTGRPGALTVVVGARADDPDVQLVAAGADEVLLVVPAGTAAARVAAAVDALSALPAPPALPALPAGRVRVVEARRPSAREDRREAAGPARGAARPG